MSRLIQERARSRENWLEISVSNLASSSTGVRGQLSDRNLEKAFRCFDPQKLTILVGSPIRTSDNFYFLENSVTWFENNILLKLSQGSSRDCTAQAYFCSFWTIGSRWLWKGSFIILPLVSKVSADSLVFFAVKVLHPAGLIYFP